MIFISCLTLALSLSLEMSQNKKKVLKEILNAIKESLSYIWIKNEAKLLLNIGLRNLELRNRNLIIF